MTEAERSLLDALLEEEGSWRPESWDKLVTAVRTERISPELLTATREYLSWWYGQDFERKRRRAALDERFGGSTVAMALRIVREERANS